MYQLYRDCSLGDQDKDWAPHVICTACSNGLRDSINKKKTAIPFAVLRKWREPKNHVGDCCFCCDSASDFFLAINKLRLVYPNLNSVMRKIPHDDNLPVPKPPENGLAFLEQLESEDGSSPEVIRQASEDQHVPEDRI
jgi:hypothetical protein